MRIDSNIDNHPVQNVKRTHIEYVSEPQNGGNPTYLGGEHKGFDEIKDILTISYQPEPEVTTEEAAPGGNWLQRTVKGGKNLWLKIWKDNSESVNPYPNVPEEKNEEDGSVWQYIKKKVLAIAAQVGQFFSAFNFFQTKQEQSKDKGEKKESLEEQIELKKEEKIREDHLMESYDRNGRHSKITVLK